MDLQRLGVWRRSGGVVLEGRGFGAGSPLCACAASSSDAPGESPCRRCWQDDGGVLDIVSRWGRHFWSYNSVARGSLVRMDSDVYSNVKFLVIFLRLWTNKI